MFFYFFISATFSSWPKGRGRGERNLSILMCSFSLPYPYLCISWIFPFLTFLSPLSLISSPCFPVSSPSARFSSGGLFQLSRGRCSTSSLPLLWSRGNCYVWWFPSRKRCDAESNYISFRYLKYFCTKKLEWRRRRSRCNISCKTKVFIAKSTVAALLDLTKGSKV